MDLAPTLLEFAGLDQDGIAERFPDLHGHSLVGPLDGHANRGGVLTAVEIVTTLDDGYWTALGEADGPARMQSGELRPDWLKRGFLRGYTDDQYTFGRYFSPLEHNRPQNLDELFAMNDVVLYDRLSDPGELINLAYLDEHRETVDVLRSRLEALIDDEIGEDTRDWITERPNLMGWPVMRGDA